MVFNLNIINLTIIITSWNKNILYKIFFIVLLNYIQFHHVWNTFDKDCIFINFLRAQQYQVKYNQE